MGVKPLVKPHPTVRGVFGGNLAGQALLVAMKTCDPEFSPHSLHSYFIRAGSDTIPVEWDVQVVSDGNSFCNRSVKGIQNGVVIYIASISLTRRNSYKVAMKNMKTIMLRFVKEQKMVMLTRVKKRMTKMMKMHLKTICFPNSKSQMD